jgi:hypothetical protein
MLMWGILLMISAAAEEFLNTSIAIRNEFWQDAIGSIGLFWLCLAYTWAFQEVVQRENSELCRAANPPRIRHDAG